MSVEDADEAALAKHRANLRALLDMAKALGHDMRKLASFSNNVEMKCAACGEHWSWHPFGGYRDPDGLGLFRAINTPFLGPKAKTETKEG